MASAYTLTEISDSHYRIAEGNVFMELLLGREKAMLIDTGYGWGQASALQKAYSPQGWSLLQPCKLRKTSHNRTRIRM